MNDEMSEPTIAKNTTCGVWLFKPKWLQIFASKKVYVIVYGLLGLNQFMLSSYFNGTLTTMEKRFKFSSKISGVISSTWDVFAIISFLTTTHLAGKGHRTRWLSIGSIIIGLSCFVRLLPHIFYGPGKEILQYTVEYSNNVNSSNISNRNDKICNSEPLIEDCQNEQTWNLPAILLCFAHAILGLGGSMYWTCGAAYLDDNVRKNTIPTLLAIVHCIRMAGPMLGYMLSAYTLTIFIEPTLTPTITNKDPRWIGAWWMGWVPIGISSFIFSFMMLLFPRMLPRTVARKNEQPEEENKDMTDFKTSVKRILKNKIIMFISTGTSFYIMGLMGYITFMSKYIETQFRQTAANANFVSGSISILSTGLGIVTSGVVMSTFKPLPRTLVSWNIVSMVLEVVGHVVYIFLGCDKADLHGHWNADKTWNLTMDCNVNCNCEQSNYNPICSFDKSTTFYSPCYAGCTETILDDGVKIYNNCTCIGNLGSATDGMCPADCNRDFIIFLVLMGVMRFFSSAGHSSNAIIQFRCVKKQDKSMALGFIEVVVALLAFIPGPVMYGAIVDTTCIVWGGECGSNGNCWLYDKERMKYYLNYTSAGFLIIGTLLDLGVWYYVKGLKIYDDNSDGCKDIGNDKNSLSIVGNYNNDTNVIDKSVDIELKTH